MLGNCCLWLRFHQVEDYCNMLRTIRGNDKNVILLGACIICNVKYYLTSSLPKCSLELTTARLPYFCSYAFRTHVNPALSVMYVMSAGSRSRAKAKGRLSRASPGASEMKCLSAAGCTLCLPITLQLRRCWIIYLYSTPNVFPASLFSSGANWELKHGWSYYPHRQWHNCSFTTEVTSIIIFLFILHWCKIKIDELR